MPDKRSRRLDWPRALAALALAVVIWVVVNAEKDASAWVPVNVTLTLDPDVALDGTTPEVQAFVTGKRRELLMLLPAGPTMQRAVTAEGTDTARLELRAADVTLPEGAALVVRDVRPRLLLVALRHPQREWDDSSAAARP